MGKLSKQPEPGRSPATVVFSMGCVETKGLVLAPREEHRSEHGLGEAAVARILQGVNSGGGFGGEVSLWGLRLSMIRCSPNHTPEAGIVADSLALDLIFSLQGTDKRESLLFNMPAVPSRNFPLCHKLFFVTELRPSTMDKNMRKIFWLIRHGASSTAGSGRWQGWSDVGLSDIGRQQALACRDSFSAREFRLVRCSSLRRCVETAELTFPDADVRGDDRLRTRNLGAWQGLTNEQIGRDGGGWFDPFAVGAPPGGESLADVTARLLSFVRERLYDNDTDHAIVTHGAIIGLLLSLVGCTPLIIPPGTFVSIEHVAQRWRLLSPPIGSVPPV